MQTIYERIELLVKNKGMTKKFFCEELVISTGNLGDWKRGKSTPSTNKLIEIGAYFEVSLDWLILGRGPQSELLRESQKSYLVDELQRANSPDYILSKKEKDFIQEYIQFADYRRNHNLEG
ncbi:transcriptional regulator with XRE-family HTH domain [Paenibacillus sp. DS2015]|uniref:helix-turn-helix domain-containing protein n=1 Tax=Paenibacillus sp. DS2015 TaxID=3373917 RepID=UPI003D1A804F